MNKKFIFVALCLIAFCCHANNDEDKQLIFADDFSKGLNTSHWVVEMDSLPGSSVNVENGQLILNTAGGVTVWLNKMLSGHFEINYTRTVVIEDGKNDRLSDLNQFWMATDPDNDNLFTRQGKFDQYDNLSMYYVGIGGNTNTTTRFRKYSGNDGRRQLLKEYLNPSHLLQKNHHYHIKIIVKNGTTSFYLDDQLFFEYHDDQFLDEGYFGFRSTYSHQAIDDFKIYKIQ